MKHIKHNIIISVMFAFLLVFSAGCNTNSANLNDIKFGETDVEVKTDISNPDTKLDVVKPDVDSVEEKLVEEKKYAVNSYFIDISNTVGVDVHTDNYSGWSWNSENIISGNIQKEMTVTFDGIEYSGSYTKSIYDKYNSFVTDYYRGDGSQFSEFGVKSGTNELVHINFMTSEYHENVNAADVIPIEECEQISDYYASQFIAIEEYERAEPKKYGDFGDEDCDPHDISYVFSYYKPIKEEISSDAVSIRVSSTGILAQIIVGDLGVFDTVPEEKLTPMLEYDVLSETTERIQNSSESEYYDLVDTEIRSLYYAITPDGDPIAIVTIRGYYVLNEDRIPKDDGNFSLDDNFTCAFRFYICVEEQP